MWTRAWVKMRSSASVCVHIGEEELTTGFDRRTYAYSYLPFLLPTPCILHIVNADPLILPGTTLALALWDHQCSPGLGLRGFIQTLRDPTKQPLVGILDGGCSGACRAVADISRYYNLVTVSGVAASPVLSDKYQYPMVRRRVPS